LKDKNGVLLKTGDLMAEVTGGGSWDGKTFSSVKLWEVPGTRDGRGNTYTSEGEKTHFYWASARSAEKLDTKKLPEGFIFAFKHGLDRLDIEESIMRLDIHEAIAKSDWKEQALTPEIVENMKAVSGIKITSFVDIAQKWDSIFGFGRVPHQIVDKILCLVEYHGAVPHNGEIGIAAMYDHFAFMSVYETFKKWKDAGCLLEKCKALDIKSGG